MSQLGHSQPGRTNGKSGHVRYAQPAVADGHTIRINGSKRCFERRLAISGLLQGTDVVRSTR